MRKYIVTVTYNDYAMGTHRVQFGPFQNLTECAEFSAKVKRIRDEEIAKFCPEGTRIATRNVPQVEVRAILDASEEEVRGELRYFLPFVPLKKEGE